MKSVHIEFRYEKGEYIKAVQTYLFAEGSINLIDFVIFPIILLLDILYMMYYEINLLSVLVLTANVFVIVMLIMLYWVTARISWEKIEGLQEDHIMTFRDEELHCFTKSQNTHIKWDTYKGFLDCKDYYYLISDKGKYTVIPKRVFGEIEKQFTFEMIATRHIERIS
jgi:hypothetical protein